LLSSEPASLSSSSLSPSSTQACTADLAMLQHKVCDTLMNECGRMCAGERGGKEEGRGGVWGGGALIFFDCQCSSHMLVCCAGCDNFHACRCMLNSPSSYDSLPRKMKRLPQKKMYACTHHHE
jgi:hypothetical protein